MAKNSTYVYEIVDTKTGKSYIGDVQDIVSKTNITATYVQMAARENLLIDKRYRCIRHTQRYKVHIYAGRVKYASTMTEMEEIFGYSPREIFEEMKANNYTSAFGCKVEREIL